MGKMSGVLAGADKKLDAIEERLKDKELVLPTDMIGAGIFLIFSIVMLVLMDKQVPVGEADIINGRMFPTLLLVIMIICCAMLFVSGLIKIHRKEPVSTCTLHLLTEMKALIIMVILGASYFICRLTDMLVLGAVFCPLGFLLIFQCRKRRYYLITIAWSVVLWCALRFGLGVRF